MPACLVCLVLITILNVCTQASQRSALSADAPCAHECTQELYPQHGDFDACYACGKSHPFQQADLGSIEIVFQINYTRGSLLLGGVQSTLSTTCVSLLEEEGMKVCQHCISFLHPTCSSACFESFALCSKLFGAACVNLTVNLQPLSVQQQISTL